MFIRFLFRKLYLVTKHFSTDPTMISYVSSIVPSFMGKYGSAYTQDTESWRQRKPKKELDPNEYAPYSRESLVALVEKVFLIYELDWTKKDWEHMQSYITPEYLEEQRNLFERDFGDNFDINYDPRVDTITPITLKSI